MQVRHVEQALAGLLGSDLEHKGPLRYAEFDVARLRHLIWNGFGNEARRALRDIIDVPIRLRQVARYGSTSGAQIFGQISETVLAFD